MRAFSPRQNHSRPALAFVGALIVLSACSSPSQTASSRNTPEPRGTATAAAAGGGAADVTVMNFKFAPEEVRVPVGGTVTWTNRDTVLHTVTSGATSGEKNVPDGRFDGRLDGEGKVFSHTFDEPGTYTYYCSQHNVMAAKVDVG